MIPCAYCRQSHATVKEVEACAAETYRRNAEDVKREQAADAYRKAKARRERQLNWKGRHNGSR